MSEIALRMRSARQVWAAPGSPHDRLVGFLQWALPVAIGVLAAFLVTAPIYSANDVSFVLDKNKVEVAHERLKIQAAEYRGEDGKGRPFTLSAQSAVQKSSAEPIVRITGLAAGIELADGPASLKADTARYNMDTQKVTVDGPVNFTGPNGYDLKTQDATVDLKQRTMTSGGDVTGTVPQGSFSADSLNANLEQRSVSLDGHAHLRIVPARTR